MLHLQVVQVVTIIAAFALAATRILTATRPYWAVLPAWLAGVLPSLVVAVPALGQAVMGARTWTDLTVAFLTAGALLMPGAHSHTVGSDKPSVPPLAVAAFFLAFLLLPLAIFCQACGLFSSSGPAAPVVAKCAPSPQELLSEVGMVLLQGGDFATTEAALKKIAGEYTESTVDCAVAVLVDEWTNPSAKADDAHLAGAARGRAHLAAKQ